MAVLGSDGKNALAGVEVLGSLTEVDEAVEKAVSECGPGEWPFDARDTNSEYRSPESASPSRK